VGTVTHKRANSAGRNSIGSLSRKVLIHGAQTDNSWSSQIARLWQKTTDTYEAELSQIQDQDEDQDMRIRVIVRKRPMSSQEKTADTDVIHPLQYGGSYGKILVYQPKTSVDLTRSVEVVPFCFDNVFDEAASNADIYEQAVRHLIPSVFDEGKWASVFAYGQVSAMKSCDCRRRMHTLIAISTYFYSFFLHRLVLVRHTP
jgi:kinesin family protein 2/24